MDVVLAVEIGPGAAVVGSNQVGKPGDRDDPDPEGERSPIYRIDCARGLTVASIAAGSGA